MKFMANGKYLNDAMKRMMSTVTEKRYEIIRDSVKITADESGVYVQTDSVHSTARMMLHVSSVEFTEPSESVYIAMEDCKNLFTLDGDVLFSSSSKLAECRNNKKRSCVTTQMVEEEKVLFKHGKEDDHSPCFEIKTDEFLKALDVCESARSNDNNRETLQGFSFYYERMKLGACDGFRAHIVNLTESMKILSGGYEDFTMNSYVRPHLNKLFPSPSESDVLRVTVLSESVRFESGDIVYSVSRIAGAPVDVLKLLHEQSEAPYVFRIDNKELSGVIKAYSAAYHKKHESNTYLALDDEGILHTMFSNGQTYKTADKLECCRAEKFRESRFFAQINVNYLLDALKLFGNEEIVMYNLGVFSHTNKCCIVSPFFLERGNILAMVLPINIIDLNKANDAMAFMLDNA